MASPFASLKVSDPIALPFDRPHTITVRKLTGRQVEIAQAEHMRGLIAGQSSRGWSAKFNRALANGASDDEAQSILTDPLNGFDRHTVAAFGLVSWSYEPTTPTTKQVEDLDDEALEFIALEVMRLTKPHLFQTIEEAEAARKKD